MTTPTHVYFIKPVGMAGPIKIGCSWHTRERLKTLSTWSPFPLEIIVIIPGSYKLEKNIHACFADLHSHREWFHAGDRLLKAIDLLKQGIPVERAIDLNNRVGKITKGRCGGAGWDEKTRQKMSVIHRVRFALKRIGVDNYRLAPTALRAVIEASEERMLSAEEAAKLDAFVSNPEPFREECQAAFREWKSRWDKLQNPTSERGAA